MLKLVDEQLRFLLLLSSTFMGLRNHHRQSSLLCIHQLLELIFESSHALNEAIPSSQGSPRERHTQVPQSVSQQVDDESFYSEEDIWGSKALDVWTYFEIRSGQYLLRREVSKTRRALRTEQWEAHPTVNEIPM